MLMNVDRALGIMKEQGIQALVATQAENVTYSTDMETSVPTTHLDAMNLVLLPAEEKLAPTLIIQTSRLALVADRPNRIKEVRSCGYFNYFYSPDSKLTGSESKIREIMEKNCYPKLGQVDVLIKTIKEKGLEKAKIGLDERGISAAVKAQIIKELPQAQIVDAFGLFRTIRRVKTQDEIGYLRQAAAINEGAILHFLSCLKVGVSERDLLKEFHQHLIRNGAEKGHFNNGGGTRSGGLFPPSDYKFKKGDLYRFDVGCTYHNYFADTGGVYIVGQDPNEKQKKIYRAMELGVETALSLCKPGVRPSQIYNAAMEVVKKNGIPDYQRHHLGHGIGIELYESPLIRPAEDASSVQLAGASDSPLEENMTMSVEVPFYELGFGGFQIEWTVVITKNGYEFIIPYNRRFSRLD